MRALASPFTNRFRYVVLTSPWLLFLVSILMTDDFQDHTNPHRSMLEFALVALINFPHNLLTFTMFLLPEVRTGVREYVSEMKWGFGFRAVLVSLFGVWVVQLHLKSLVVDTVTLNLTLALVAAISFQHYIRQISGICASYDQRLFASTTLSQQERGDFDLMRRVERVGFAILAPSICLYAGLDFMNYRTYPVLAEMARWGVLVSVGGLIANTIWQWSRFGDGEKLVFVSRVGLYGFWAAGILRDHILVMNLANHALEYMGVYDRMTMNSTLSRKWFYRGHLVYFIVLLVFTPAIVVMHAKAFPGLVPEQLPIWLAALLYGVAIMQMYHVFFDRIFFRMRTAAIRAHIAPLLRIKSVAAATEKPSERRAAG